MPFAINLLERIRYYPDMTIILIILAVILAIALLSITIGEFFLRFALSTSYDNSNKFTDDSVSEQYLAEEEENRRFLEEKCSDVYIKSADTMNLHAYLFSSSSHKYLITVHGYKGGATNNGILYRFMANKGYNVLIPDVRGHGKSEGKWLSMGLWESDDLIRWVSYIKEQDENAQIALHGVSMGGATVMMASGRNPSSVVAIIEDCGYSSVYDEFKCQLKDMFHLPAHPILDIVNLWCRIRLKFSFADVVPSSEVAKTHIPMLFIHGDEDMFVPTWMVNTCYEKARCSKELWITNGVAHAMSITKYADEYTSKCLSFIEKHMKA